MEELRQITQRDFSFFRNNQDVTSFRNNQDVTSTADFLEGIVATGTDWVTAILFS
jgi:hypothetical protein